MFFEQILLTSTLWTFIIVWPVTICCVSQLIIPYLNYFLTLSLSLFCSFVTIMSAIASYVEPLFVDQESFIIRRVDRDGTCGWKCIAKLCGFPTWADAFRRVYDSIDNPFHTQEGRERLERVYSVIMQAESPGALDSDCHLTEDIRKCNQLLDIHIYC